LHKADKVVFLLKFFVGCHCMSHYFVTLSTLSAASVIHVVEALQFSILGCE